MAKGNLRMTVLNNLTGRAPRYVLLVAVTASLFVLVMLLSPVQPIQRHAAALLGIWLCVASLIRYVALRAESSRDPIRWIPVRFSGDLGRFELRARGDGRRVEVRAGTEVVAEAIASDDGDELVLDFEAASDSELEAFGAAIGQAIEMVAVADEDRPAERRIAGPASWGNAPRPSSGGVLRRIGQRVPRNENRAPDPEAAPAYLTCRR